MLIHHELCFGCGRTNLFGIHAELERTGEQAVKGRSFIKQDHQGPERGHAHPGIIIAALVEAITFTPQARGPIERLEIALLAPVAVGTFLEVSAAGAIAAASAQGMPVARASATHHG